MTTQFSNSQADDLGNDLFTILTSDLTVDLPAVDLADPIYNLGNTDNDPLWATISELTIDELTTEQLDGSGAFDILMRTYALHLQQEYKAGRIVGSEYAKTYIELTANAMSQAMQFVLGKDQSYWQALMVQAQAKGLKIQNIQALVQLAKLKAEYALSELAVSKGRADLGLAKMTLSTEDARYALTKTQNLLEQYRLANVMPAELAHVQGQTQMVTSQRLNVEQERAKMVYDLATLLPDQHNLNLQQIQNALKQNEKLDSEILTEAYQRQELMPAQVLLITAQTTQADMQTSKLSAERDGAIYNTNFMLPSQRENVIADTAGKNYQTTQILPAQRLGILADTENKDYTRTQILPAQRDLARESMEAKRAETLNNRSDGAAVTGSIGKQKDLYSEQITSYRRDAETKLARSFIDTWVARRGTNDTETVPSSLADAQINTVLTRLRANLDLT